MTFSPEVGFFVGLLFILTFIFVFIVKRERSKQTTTKRYRETKTPIELDAQTREDQTIIPEFGFRHFKNFTRAREFVSSLCANEWQRCVAAMVSNATHKYNNVIF